MTEIKIHPTLEKVNVDGEVESVSEYLHRICKAHNTLYKTSHLSFTRNDDDDSITLVLTDPGTKANLYNIDPSTTHDILLNTLSHIIGWTALMDINTETAIFIIENA